MRARKEDISKWLEKAALDQDGKLSVDQVLGMLSPMPPYLYEIWRGWLFGLHVHAVEFANRTAMLEYESQVQKEFKRPVTLEVDGKKLAFPSAPDNLKDYIRSTLKRPGERQPSLLTFEPWLSLEAIEAKVKKCPPPEDIKFPASPNRQGAIIRQDQARKMFALMTQTPGMAASHAAKAVYQDTKNFPGAVSVKSLEAVVSDSPQNWVKQMPEHQKFREQRLGK